jgi:hypothetical protein
MAGDMSLGKILIEFGVELGDLKSGLQQVTRQLEDQKKSTESAGSSLSGMAQKWFFVKNAIQDVAGVAKDMLDAWAQQQRAVNQLNMGLANQGNLLPGVTEKFMQQATALQSVTTFADDAILSGQALLATSGKTAAEIQAATPAILDMAAAMGMDLNSAFQLATKAAVGQTSVLSRYGIKIAEGIPENQKFAAVIQQLETRFGGMAQVLAQDATGKMVQFQNAIGDVKEEIGKFTEFFITSTVGGIGGQGMPILTRLGKFFGEDLIIFLGMARQGFANMVAGILEGAAGIGTAVSTISGWFGSTFGQAQVEQLKMWAQGFRDAGQALYDESVAAATAKVGTDALTQSLLAQSAVNAANKQGIYDTNVALADKQFKLLAIPPAIAAATMSEMEYIASLQGFSAEQLAISQQNAEAHAYEVARRNQLNDQLKASFQRLGITMRSDSQATADLLRQDYEAVKASGQATAEQLDAAWKKYEEARRVATGETTNFSIQSSLQLAEASMGAFSQIGSQFKAFAIAQGIISTYLAIARALAAPWPASLVFAAQAAAMGWATVNKIRGTQAFASGTKGLDFQNFGKEAPAMLHGREAVIPQGGGHALADEIASSLGRTAFAPTAMAIDVEQGTSAPGDSGAVQNVIMLDGKVLAEWYENASKRGAVRTHTIAVKEF